MSGTNLLPVEEEQERRRRSDIILPRNHPAQPITHIHFNESRAISIFDLRNILEHRRDHLARRTRIRSEERHDRLVGL